MNDSNTVQLNDYIQAIIQTDGIEFVIQNYNNLREDYYNQKQ